METIILGILALGLYLIGMPVYCILAARRASRHAESNDRDLLQLRHLVDELRMQVRELSAKRAPTIPPAPTVTAEPPAARQDAQAAPAASAPTAATPTAPPAAPPVARPAVPAAVPAAVGLV